VGWRVRVQVIAHGVDDDMVMKPADGCEVVGFCDTALGEGGDVVGLEPVAGRAAVDGAAAVSP